MAIKRYWETIEYSEYIAVIKERDDLKARLAEYVRRARAYDHKTDSDELWELINDLAAEKVE